ncbi:MAG: putative Ig domain-containing protein [Gemmatimonadota bacterium]|nr:putative Ig domain-containing protein [Gemmatimonadota bacterium]MDE2985419.1 putative Ig domain-containing protein [Gemmatimonadota bacterium]
MLSCDWITALGNDPPTAVGTIPDQVVEVDSAVVLDLAPHFDDPDGDSLTYRAGSAASVAASSVVGGMLTVTGVAKGGTSVTVTAQDPDGLTAAQSFSVTVPNRAPVVSDTIADGEVYVDSALVIDAAAYFTDPDGDDLHYSPASADPARAAVAVSGSAVTVTGMAVGSAVVTVTARDPAGLAAEQSFEVAVPNRTPAAAGTIEDRVVEVDSVFALDVTPYFADPDRDSLVYAATSSDPGKAVVVLSGSRLTLTGAAKGAVTVTVTARDPGGLEAEQGFTVTIPNRPPAAEGAIEDRELFVGDALEVDVAAHFADPDGDPLEYAAVSSDPDRAAVAVSGGVVTMTGRAVGNATVTVTARDPEGLSAGQGFVVTVPNRAPLPVGTIADRDVHVGDTVTLGVAAWFTEPDGETLAYAAASSGSGTATAVQAGGVLTIAGVTVGEAIVTVTARDPHGAEVEQRFGVAVPNRAPGRVGRIPDRVIEVDSAAVVDVADRFTEPDGQDLEYEAASSDTTRVGVSMSGSMLNVRGVARGAATVTVTARDPGGLAAEQHFGVTVPNRVPRPVGTIDQRVVRAGSSVAVDVAANFTDPDGDSLRYGATSTDPGRATVAVAGSVIAVTGVAGGHATVTVTARDPAGLSARQEFGVRVPNQAPEATGAIADRAVEINRSVSLELAPYFSDPDGDDLSHSATSSNTTRAAVSVVGSTVTITGRRVGTVTVTAAATDPGGLAATRAFRVRIVQGNRTPRAVGTIPDAAVPDGNTLSVNVASYFRDPDGDDLEYDASSSHPGVATAGIAGTTLTVAGVAEGDAIVTVTASDPGGLSVTQRFDVSVEPAPPSDLVVGPPTANPNVLGPGESFTLSAAARNQGDGPALSGTTLRYYRSSDATIDAGDTEIGTDAVPRLGPSQTSTRSLPVTAPDALGTYYYGACADAVDNESDTDNNCSGAVAVEVTESNRAPRAEGAIPDTSLNASDAASIDVAPYFTDPDGDDLVYAAASTSTEVATATRSGSTVTVTATGAGDATITVTATDPGGLTATHRFDVTVYAGPESDLLILWLAANPDVLRPGESFSLGALVYNRGAGGTSSSTTLRYYRSSDATINTADTEIGSDAVPLLGPSRSNTESDSVTAPSSEGTYYYGACVDAVGNESDPNNNCSGAAEVEVTRANRAPRTAGAISDETVTAGNGITVDAEPYFTDPDDDDLDYTATSSDTDVATVTVSGTDVRVEAHDGGDATIRVTATDPGGLSAAQSFELTVEDLPNQAPVVTSELDDILATARERYASYLPDVFTDPDGNDLTWTTSSSDTDVARPRIAGDSIIIRARALGSVTVSVTATDPGGLFATDEFEVEVVAARFDIDLHFTSSVTSGQRSRIEAARDRWEAILMDTEPDDVEFNKVVNCMGIEEMIGTVDDILIFVDADSIDGPGNYLAEARFCDRRNSQWFPVTAGVIFDEADMSRLLSEGSLADLAFHEFAHNLGFAPFYFENHNLLRKGADPHFTGVLAVEAFDSAGGDDYTGNKVPLEKGGWYHWRQNVFGREGMTALFRVGSTIPYSAVTLQAMADLGYEADVSLADDYDLPGSLPPPDADPGEDGEVFDLSGDVVMGPVRVVDPNGRVVRIIPSPEGATRQSFRRPRVLIDPWRTDRSGSWIRSPAPRRQFPR